MKAVRNPWRPLRGIAVSAVAMMAAGLTVAAGSTPLTPTPDPILTVNDLLAQAQVDECFAGVGIDYPPLNPDLTCPSGSRTKTNQSYIWGLTEQSGVLWFGTLANAACVVGGQAPSVPISSNLIVCEFGQSQYARSFPAIPPSLGDWRPPEIWSYDMTSGALVQRSQLDPLINQTLGFRGAGSIDNIAFVAGQALAANAINIFAYKADTGDRLGSCSRTDYSYIRQWQVVDGVLYAGVGSPTHGGVLRWTGNMDSFNGNFCDDFEEVAYLPAYAANIVKYTGSHGQDRLAVTTVPIRTGGGGTGTGVGVWISPPVGATGLTPANAHQWFKVWDPSVYDPDPVISQFGYSGGALQQFDGWLYWGTIHLPNSGATRVAQTCTDPTYCFGVPNSPAARQELKTYLYRTASVWRGRNLEDVNNREIQLLYGETQLPVCCSAPQTYSMQPTGWTPLYGTSGFGNPANEYIWTMALFDSHLFVGTFDATALQGGGPETGADLWRFDSSDGPAVNENYAGLGDRLNYGIRAMLPLDDGSGLIVGMANPANLAPGGGWELRRLSEPPAAARKPAAAKKPPATSVVK